MILWVPCGNGRAEISKTEAHILLVTFVLFFVEVTTAQVLPTISSEFFISIGLSDDASVIILPGVPIRFTLS